MNSPVGPSDRANGPLHLELPTEPASSLSGSPSGTPATGSTRKPFKTEYKSKYTPFDQYSYNGQTDSFVRHELPIGSNQNLASLSSPSGAHEAVAFQPTSNGHPMEQPEEPWYREVVRRKEQANEYRFKSEVGHNSPLLSHTQLVVDSAERSRIGSPLDSEEQQTTGEQSSEQQVRYKFTPGDYKSDHLIAHMANNNNFAIPKAEVSSSSSSTRRGLASARLAGSQARARSQSSRRQAPSSAGGPAPATSRAAAGATKSQQTTPTRSRPTPAHPTPTSTTTPTATTARLRVTPKTALNRPSPSVGTRPPTASSATKRATVPTKPKAAGAPTPKLTNGSLSSSRITTTSTRPAGKAPVTSSTRPTTAGSRPATAANSRAIPPGKPQNAFRPTPTRSTVTASKPRASPLTSTLPNSAKPMTDKPPSVAKSVMTPKAAAVAAAAAATLVAAAEVATSGNGSTDTDKPTKNEEIPKSQSTSEPESLEPEEEAAHEPLLEPVPEPAPIEEIGVKIEPTYEAKPAELVESKAEEDFLPEAEHFAASEEPTNLIFTTSTASLHEVDTLQNQLELDISSADGGDQVEKTQNIPDELIFATSTLESHEPNILENQDKLDTSLSDASEPDGTTDINPDEPTFDTFIANKDKVSEDQLELDRKSLEDNEPEEITQTSPEDLIITSSTANPHEDGILEDQVKLDKSPDGIGEPDETTKTSSGDLILTTSTANLHEDGILEDQVKLDKSSDEIGEPEDTTKTSSEDLILTASTAIPDEPDIIEHHDMVERNLDHKEPDFTTTQTSSGDLILTTPTSNLHQGGDILENQPRLDRNSTDDSEPDEIIKNYSDELINGLSGGLISAEDRFDSSERDMSSGSSVDEVVDVIAPTETSSSQLDHNAQEQPEEMNLNDEPYSIMDTFRQTSEQAADFVVKLDPLEEANYKNYDSVDSDRETSAKSDMLLDLSQDNNNSAQPGSEPEKEVKAPALDELPLISSLAKLDLEEPVPATPKETDSATASQTSSQTLNPVYQLNVEHLDAKPDVEQRDN